MPRVFSPSEFVFDGDAVVRRGRETPVVRIVPDAKYPGMWRAEYPDGRLSDMINKTHAKDAALVLAARLEGDRSKLAAE
jgi:hypothetical protein